MKKIQNSLLTLGFIVFTTVQVEAQKVETGQELIANTEVQNESKEAYYQRRAREDAKFEQQFEAQTEAEEEEFWENQQAYEKKLKKTDLNAYRAYMRGKRDAYREHHKVCDAHCHHSTHYQDHVRFYYYREYRRAPTPARTRISAGIRVNTPRIGIGF